MALSGKQQNDSSRVPRARVAQKFQHVMSVICQRLYHRGTIAALKFSEKDLRGEAAKNPGIVFAAVLKNVCDYGEDVLNDLWPEEGSNFEIEPKQVFGHI